MIKDKIDNESTLIGRVAPSKWDGFDIEVIEISTDDEAYILLGCG